MRPADLINVRKALAVKPEKGALAHGAYSYLNTGEVPEHSPHVLEDAHWFREGLLSAEAMGSGADGEANAKRLALVDSATRMYVVSRLLFDDIMKRGLHVTKKSGRKELNYCIKALTSFENTMRLNLTLLGLDRQQRPTQDLAGYIQGKYTHPGEGDDPDE